MNNLELAGIGFESKAFWNPSPDGTLSGEVKNNKIYVYEEEAVVTLKQNFLDYCISQAIQPYKEVTNRLIRMINDGAYKKRERIAEALIKLLSMHAEP